MSWLLLDDKILPKADWLESFGVGVCFVSLWLSDFMCLLVWKIFDKKLEAIDVIIIS